MRQKTSDGKETKPFACEIIGYRRDCKVDNVWDDEQRGIKERSKEKEEKVIK